MNKWKTWSSANVNKTHWRKCEGKIIKNVICHCPLVLPLTLNIKKVKLFVKSMFLCAAATFNSHSHGRREQKCYSKF